MTIPSVAIEMALTTNPLDSTPVWEAFNGRCKSLSISRGRRRELDSFSANRASIVLDDVTRTLDPEYAAGPYYGDILPDRLLRVSVLIADIWTRLFTGPIEDYDLELNPSEILVHIEASDASAALANEELTTSYPLEYSHGRINRVLDDIGWPAAKRLIRPGHTLVPAVTLDHKKAISHMREVEQAERGELFVDGDGYFVFRERHYRDAKSTTIRATFGNHTDYEPIVELGYSLGNRTIFNDVRMTAEGSSTEFIEEDAASQARHFKRTWTESGLLHSDAEAQNAAEYFLSTYKDAKSRFTPMTIDAQATATLAALSTLEIGERIRVHWRPMGQTPAIVQDLYIEGIKHRYRAGGSWLTTWDLSPAPPVPTDVWILNQSVLEVDTYLVY